MKRTFYKNFIQISFNTSLVLGTVCSAVSSSPLSRLPVESIKDYRLSKISDILLRCALTYDIDKRSVDMNVSQKGSIPFKGFEHIQAKIQAALQQNRLIKLNLVGFPFKSTNTERKVLGSQLDAAERYSLDYLNTMLKEISKIYAPGAVLTVFMDGMVFSDIEGVDDQAVITYEQQLKQISRDLHHIRIVTLSDLLPGKSPAEMRSIIESYEPHAQDFQEKISKDSHLQEEINLLTKRTSLELDHPASRAYLVCHTAKEIATRLTHRGMQYSAFLKAHRPKEAIRLSVHYQPDVSIKMGIKLSENSFVTPWHGVLVQHADGSCQISHLEDLDSKNYSQTVRLVNGISLPFLTWRRR